MKILLINPPVGHMIENKEYFIPSSLMYLASVLQQNGEEVNLLDLNTLQPWTDSNHTIEEICNQTIINRIKEFKPDIAGIGCLFSGHIGLVIRFSEAIKDNFPHIRTVIGGIHPTLYPYDILKKCPTIDFVVIGEGELTIIKLVSALKSGTADFERIEGLAYRKETEVYVNPRVSFITDLDTIPFPAYNLINFQDYFLESTAHWHNPRNLQFNVSVPIISSRACPMQCTFCSMHNVMGRKWRPRSAKNVVDEIEYLYNERGVRHFTFFDDQLTLNKPRIIELANEILRRNLYLEIESQNGVMVRSLDAEVFDALTSVGLVRIALAIESGSDYIRNDVMGKKLPSRNIYEVARLTKHYPQLYVKAFFIMGMPEDTEETLQATYSMIQEIDVDMPQIFNLLPFPGTRVFEQVVHDHLLTEEIDLENLWRFEGFYGSGNKTFFVKPYQMKIEELSAFREKFDELVVELMARKKAQRTSQSLL